jgi:hypothetical protein
MNLFERASSMETCSALASVSSNVGHHTEGDTVEKLDPKLGDDPKRVLDEGLEEYMTLLHLQVFMRNGPVQVLPLVHF